MESYGDKLGDRVTTVLGLSELLLEEAYGSLSPQQKRILRDIVRAASDLRDLVRQNPPEFVHD